MSAARILVIGSLVAQAQHLDALVVSRLAHLHRSRGEPGCLSHSVHRGVENPLLRRVFFEKGAHCAAAALHFAVPAVRAFARSVGALAADPPTMAVYEATPITL